LIAKESNFLEFLKAPKQLVIPIYQRTYSWKLQECEQLWKDIIKSGNDKTVSGHFIGSIVYVLKGLYHTSKLSKLLVIDGQQRLTTLSLLICALYNHIKNNNIQTEIKPNQLLKYYLINDEEEGEEKYKLILNQSDKTTLFKIINKDPLNEHDSVRIKENYNFFSEQIAKTDLDLINSGIEKLVIIDVSLDREKDNPQLIFESLNSTGLELTQADLIRNYILMGLEKEKQEFLYKTYWYPMEKNFGHSENSVLFDRFMKDYLTIKIGKIPTIREIYSEFKQYSVKISDINILVKDINKFANYYVKIALDKELNVKLKTLFNNINELKVDVSYPFILNVYNDYTENIIQEEEFEEILALIESYVFRRAICGLPTNSLNKTFATLYKDIDKENYLESIKATFMLMDSYKRLPDNDEFKTQFIIKDVYNFRNRNYLLSKLENHDRKEIVNVNSYTIEHIMPQDLELSQDWINNLGENWKEIQKSFLHTIGNLTLTGYNSEMSNRPFKTKRDMPNGFKDSPIKINKMLANIEIWNEQTIKNRANEIAKLAIRIWTYPDIEKEILKKYKKSEVPREQIYKIEDHKFLREGEPMRTVFDELQKKILNIDSSVKEVHLKQYIAYKSDINFVDIIPQKNALILSLNIPLNRIKDPKGKCRDMSNKGKWGNGDIEFKLTSMEDIEYSLTLIKQAFDNIVEFENGS